MGRRQRVIIGFAGLFLSIIAGAICADARFAPGEFLSFVAGAFFFIGAYKAVFSGNPVEPGQRDKRPELDTIERRLTDIQDVVISIDDRLKRLESASRTVTEESTI